MISEEEYPDNTDFDNDHRCENCGLTGGGVEGGLCEDCFARLVPNEWHSKW